MKLRIAALAAFVALGLTANIANAKDSKLLY